MTLLLLVQLFAFVTQALESLILQFSIGGTASGT